MIKFTLKRNLEAVIQNNSGFGNRSLENFQDVSHIMAGITIVPGNSKWSSESCVIPEKVKFPGIV